MSGEKPLVIVLSRNYSTGLGVIRSLGAAGYTVDLIASVKKRGSAVIASSSKYVRRSVEVLSEKIQGDDGEGIIREILSYRSDTDTEKVLFPVDDFTAAVVAENSKILKKDFIFPDLTDGISGDIVRYMDKTFQADIAVSHRLDVPKYATVSLREKIEVPGDISYPCFVKPLKSIAGQKMEMGVFFSEEDLHTHLEHMKGFYSDRSVLIQEYLDIEKEYDICGACLDQEIIIPAVIEKTRIAGYERGVTMSGRLIPEDELGSAKESIRQMLADLHYTGMFDLELIKTRDRLYFSEINFRSGGPSFSYFLCGANLPAIVVDHLTTGTHDKNHETLDEYGKTFVYEKVAWEDMIRGFMTKDEFRDCIENSDLRLLENEDDPEPGRYFNKRIRMSAMKHRALQMAGREKRASKTAQGKAASSGYEVVVAGRNSGNLLAMARDLGMAGYGVCVLRLYKSKPKVSQILRKMKPEAYSRYVKEYHECIADDDMRKVAEKLIGLAGERTLLVPVDDYSAYLVDEFRDMLSERYIVPGIRDTQGAEAELMDKSKQKKLAEKAGLPVLKSAVITDEKHIPDDVPFPCFIKPLVSMRSVKTVMNRCDDITDLKEKIGEGGLIAEEFADIAEEYALMGYSSGKRTIAPCLFKTLRPGSRARKGVAATGVTVPCDQLGDMIDKSIDLVDSLGYTGLFDIDFIKDTQGRMFFLEINFRAGASMHVFAKRGINLAGIMADDLLNGIESPDIEVDVPETTFASEKVLLEEYASGDLSKAEFEKEINSADVLFIYDEKDMTPYKHYRKSLKLVETFRKIKKKG